MNRGGGTPAYPRGSTTGYYGETETRARLADAYAKKRGQGKYDTRTSAQKKADNRRNLIFVGTTFIPLGWGYRGLRSLHYGMKGAKPLVFTSRGKQAVRFYDLEAKRFISKRSYRLRQGLEQAPRKGWEGTKAVARKIEDTRLARAARKYETGHTLVTRGPTGLLKKRVLNRIIPRPIQWVLGAGWALSKSVDTANDIQNYLDRSHEDPSGPTRSPFVFNRPRVGNQKPVRWVTSRHTKKSVPRCPPGYRYSSQANACLRFKP